MHFRVERTLESKENISRLETGSWPRLVKMFHVYKFLIFILLGALFLKAFEPPAE